jgi:hypothetical protein
MKNGKVVFTLSKLECVLSAFIWRNDVANAQSPVLASDCVIKKQK